MAKFTIACRGEDQEAKQLLTTLVPRGFRRCGASSRVKVNWLEASQRTATQEIRQIRQPDLEAIQAEVNRGYGVTVKLESLCQKLQHQTNSLVEERKQLTEI